MRRRLAIWRAQREKCNIKLRCETVQMMSSFLTEIRWISIYPLENGRAQLS